MPLPIWVRVVLLATVVAITPDNPADPPPAAPIGAKVMSSAVTALMERPRWLAVPKMASTTV